MDTIQKLDLQINDISSQMDDMYLTLFKIKKMIDNGVRVEEISNNEIKFIKGADEESCSIKSGSTIKIGPDEIENASRFIKEKKKKKIAEDSIKFNLLRKEEKCLKRNFDANMEFI